MSRCVALVGILLVGLGLAAAGGAWLVGTTTSIDGRDAGELGRLTTLWTGAAVVLAIAGVGVLLTARRLRS